MRSFLLVPVAIAAAPAATTVVGVAAMITGALYVAYCIGAWHGASAK